MPHVGGSLQAQFMARIRGRDLQRCLVAPIDVGKVSAKALIADHYGEIVGPPLVSAPTNGTSPPPTPS
jgi:transposase